MRAGLKQQDTGEEGGGGAQVGEKETQVKDFRAIRRLKWREAG